MNRIVTDNTKTLANALDRIKALESLLAEAGSALVEYSKHDLSEIRMLVDAIDAILPATDNHDSDCATHNMPAYPNGDCDCRLATEGKKDEK